MAVERHTLRELEQLIKDGNKYKLFKPFLINGQVFINVEKILTEKDIFRLDGKVYGPIEVVPGVEHKVDNKITNSLIDNIIKILKTSKLFKVNDIHHIDFEKRKECEKLITGVIGGSFVLADSLLKIYKYSKKLFVHSVKVGLISAVIELGLQQKRKRHNALLSEELLTGALLHDIGFLNLPKSLVEKHRYEYTDEEKRLYKTYPLESKKIASSLGDVIRKKSLLIIEQHQEKLLGHGFPQGLKGEAIDELALIIGLADEFELIVSKETSNHDKSMSDIMSRMSRSSKIFGYDVVNSFYTWFRYLK